AVQNAALVRVLEAGQDLSRDGDGALGANGAVIEQIGERLALDVFHDEIGRALIDAEVDERDAVRMIETRRRPRFTLEAIDDARLVVQDRVQELDDDGTADTDALGFVDDAHAAFRQHGLQPVATLQHLAFARVRHVSSD
ncbi:MAG TPA: hypothetical protein VH054_06945, partial [Polyangiaceae bacterium]|nr:hypothetical protein [Polyangiaceae bacterium]